ncbi:hypothetical protein [Enhygromyxa salina]|nr:hypothetical protein [Enhygromyxa salina]
MARSAPPEVEQALTAATGGCGCSSQTEPTLPDPALALLALLGLERVL